LIRIRFNKDYGAVDNNGKVVIMPFYKNPFTFKDGYAAVFDGNKFGFIDKNGKVVYPFILDSAENFDNGQAKVVKNNASIILTINDLELE